MTINTKQIVSISEANQNFSKIAKLVDSQGEIIIFKNNKPRYKIIDPEQNSSIEMTDDEKIKYCCYTKRSQKKQEATPI